MSPACLPASLPPVVLVLLLFGVVVHAVGTAVCACALPLFCAGRLNFGPWALHISCESAVTIAVINTILTTAGAQPKSRAVG